ncbi:MAG TPA: hypothetical protein VKP30_13115 [Polyangiaceae bacterium]|nr:hypothetical protein [Polyangiaceae bacterium]
MLKSRITRAVNSGFLLCVLECIGCEGTTAGSDDSSRSRESGGAHQTGTSHSGGVLGLGGAGTTMGASDRYTSGGTRVASAIGGTNQGRSTNGAASGGVSGHAATGDDTKLSPATGGSSATSPTSAACDNASALGYDQMILCEHPVAYWAMTGVSDTEPDLSPFGNMG